MESGTGIVKNKPLAPYSGIKIGGKAAWFAEVSDILSVRSVLQFATQHRLTIVPLGSGTNSFFGSGKLNVCIIKNNLRGKSVIQEDAKFVEVKISSGEVWDDVVKWAVDNGWAGIEALSAIPGTVGAAPVQNIGAYGQEVAETITAVEVIDIQSGVFRSMTPYECDFSYRNSVFKQNPDKYFIVSVTLRLHKNQHPGIPLYESAKYYFQEHKIDNPSLQQIRDGITAIRWSKLPRPEVLPNCGSWFKNPIVSKANGMELNKKFSDLKYWEVDTSSNSSGQSMVKLSAGWLVDQAVGKDYDNGYFATYGKNALVLINHSLSSSTKKFLKFEADIINQVNDKFGVILEREPILLN